MPIHNSDVAGIFNRVADILDIQAENQFRIKSARSLRDSCRQGWHAPFSPSLSPGSGGEGKVTGLPCCNQEMERWMKDRKEMGDVEGKKNQDQPPGIC